jgi:hypothetical protein
MWKCCLLEYWEVERLPIQVWFDCTNELELFLTVSIVEKLDQMCWELTEMFNDQILLLLDCPERFWIKSHQEKILLLCADRDVKQVIWSLFNFDPHQFFLNGVEAFPVKEVKWQKKDLQFVVVCCVHNLDVFREK